MKLTFFNALFKYRKANQEILDLQTSNINLLNKINKLNESLDYYQSENKKFKSLNTSLKKQIDDLNETINILSKSDIDINITTTDNNINTDKSAEKKSNKKK